VTVYATGPDGQTASNNLTIAIVSTRPNELIATANPNGNVFSITAGQMIENYVAQVQTADPNATVTGLKAQIINQDGAQVPAQIIAVTPGSIWQIINPQTYNTPGTFAFNVQVSDDQGDSVTLQGQVTVIARSSTPNPNPTPTSNPEVPNLSPENPQYVDYGSNGYTSYEYIGHASKQVTAAKVMKILQQTPSKYFPFEITKDNAKHTKGPINGGQYYWLDPINIFGNPINPGVLQARNVTKYSFTLFVTNKHPYIVPAGSYITFSTFVDSTGDVVLKQQGVLANPNLVNLWLDQWGGPQTWLQQAANLRRSIH
jgi:hypothetical protein